MRNFTLGLLFLFFSGIAFGQVTINPELAFAQQKLEERGEFYFTFNCDNRELVREISRNISVDKVQGTTVYAYANAAEFEYFLTYNFKFTPVYDYYISTKATTMATTTAQMASWDRYPTHAVYLQMLDNFATNYPTLCRVETIGTSVDGYAVKCLVISDNVNTDEDEPEFWWSGTMHGDETCGYVLLLRMADYLLSNYGTNSIVTNIVSNMEIYINPLANPDGTFNNSTGGTSVSNATRYNANSIDLNRNFPTANGDSYTLQPEIQMMMDFSAAHDFVMSVNTHGGVELVNYPWDTWQSWERTHADHTWWQHVGFVYADEAHLDAPTGYLDGPGGMDYGPNNTTGVTHGADWYYAVGSRQDYMNYYRNLREITIELSNTKLLGTENLNAHWGYNKDAMMLYMEQALYGFRGIVTDACAGTALSDVKVEIASHDVDNSFVYTSAPVGDYHRPIIAGTYNVTFSKTGYTSKTLSVTVINDQSTRLDVQLVPTGVAVPNFTASATAINIGQSVTFTNSTSGSVTSRLWTFEGGSPATSTLATPPAITYSAAGTYDVTLAVLSSGCNVSEVKTDHITVTIPGAPTASFVADVTNSCSGLIQFTNSSVDADSYSWDFGDGTSTSSVTDPQHTYLSSGTYTVVLTATNAYASNIMTKTNYITIALPDAPVTTGAESCAAASLTLNASGTGTLQWYDAQTNGNLVTTGTSYTDNFTSTETFYVQSGVSAGIYNGGSADINTNGGDHTGNSYYMIFTAYDDFTLVSVQVNSSTAGNRIVELRNSGGTLLQSVTTNLSVGINTVTLNFDIPQGTNYRLKCGTTISNLYRNNTGTAFPYVIPGVLSITGTNASDVNFYYYYYNWVVSYDGGCVSNRTPVTASILGTPGDVTVTGGGTQCGGSMTLTATGGTDGTIYWQNTTTNGTSTSTASSSQTVSLSGTYYFRALSGTSCWGNQGSASVTINAIPTAVTVTGGGTQCGASMTLTATGGTGGTIYWQGTTSGGTSTTTASSSQSVSASGTYYFRSQSAQGCWGPEGSATVTINPLPIDVTVSGGGTQCGGSMTLTATGGTGGTIYWQNTTINGTSTATASSSQSVSTSGTYYFRSQSTQGCWGNQGSASVTINAIPTAVTVTGGGTQCGGSMILTATGGTGGTIYWQGTTSGGTSTTTASSSQTVSASGTYYFRSQSAAGCWGPEGSATVTINPLPTDVTVTGGGTQCGGSMTLAATGGTGGTIYWQNTTNNGTSTVTASASQTVSASGTYYFRSQSSASCWGNQGSATVTINPVVDISLSSTDESVAGANDGTATVTVNSGTPSYNYLWNSGSTASSLIGLTGGTYCVTVIDANGCMASECIVVNTVGAAPIANFEADITNGCDNLVVTFTDLSNNTPDSWEWNFGDGGVSTSSTTAVEHTYTTPGIYTVSLSVTNAFGTDTQTMTDYITVGETPVLSMSMTEESVTGNDGTAVVDVSGISTSYDVIWSNSAATETISGLNAGEYCVTVIEANGCQANDCITVTQVGETYPPVAAFEANDTDNCGTLTVNFTDLSTNTPDTWTWDFGDGTSTSSDSNPVHTYSTPGTYTVSLTVSNSDGSDQLVKTDYISVFPKPQLSFDITNESSAGALDGQILLSVTGGTEPYTINWSNNMHDLLITGLSANVYSVAVVDDNGCMSTGIAQVQVQTLIRSSDISSLVVYPNPATDLFYIESEKIIDFVQVFDATGRLCFEQKSNTKKVTISEKLKPGVYFLKVMQGQKVENLRIVIN